MSIPVQYDAGRATINLPHNFDVNAQSHFRQACSGVLGDARVKVIEVDFNDVRYIDSAALGSLLMLRERAEQVARNIVITKCPPQVMKVFTMANFHRIFNIQ